MSSGSPGKVQREPRIQIVPLHRIRFLPEKPVSKEPILLANFSAHGMGILRSSIRTEPSPGDQINGVIEFNNRKFEISITVIHVSHQVVGAKIESAPEGFEKAVKEYFEVELSAVLLKKVDPNNFKKAPEGEAVWFHGGNCELYYVVTGKTVNRFRIAFLGNQISGGNSVPLKFGQIMEDVQNAKMGYGGSERIIFHGAENRALSEAAIRFLANIPSLEPVHASQISGLISGILNSGS